MTLSQFHPYLNTARLRFFDENYKEEDAINRRLYNNHCFVLTTIYRFSYPNRTVLTPYLSPEAYLGRGAGGEGKDLSLHCDAPTI
jgi:hypothetical protein